MTNEKTLSLDSVINDIKADINIKIDSIEDYDGLDNYAFGIKAGLYEALEIIDKHIAE